MEVRLGIIDCVGREGDHVLHTRLLQTVYGYPLQHLNLSCPANRKGKHHSRKPGLLSIYTHRAAAYQGLTQNRRQCDRSR